MDRESIAALFRTATRHTMQVARTFVRDHLPDHIRYRVMLDVGVPEALVLTESEAIDRIYGAEGVLRWVDLSVSAADASFTYVHLYLSRDRVTDLAQTVYFARGMGPFGIKSPTLPFEWKSLEESGRFSLSK